MALRYPCSISRRNTTTCLIVVQYQVPDMLEWSMHQTSGAPLRRNFISCCRYHTIAARRGRCSTWRSKPLLSNCLPRVIHLLKDTGTISLAVLTLPSRRCHPPFFGPVCWRYHFVVPGRCGLVRRLRRRVWVVRRQGEGTKRSREM